MLDMRRVCRTVAGVLGVVWTGATGAAQQPPPTPAPVPEILRTYKPVTAERLLKPDEGDWLMIRRT
jgi:hypothetical protein